MRTDFGKHNVTPLDFVLDTKGEIYPFDLACEQIMLEGDILCTLLLLWLIGDINAGLGGKGEEGILFPYCTSFIIVTIFIKSRQHRYTNARVAVM